jgi:hypothetical protein
VVVSEYTQSLAIQAGDYVVSAGDLPLLQANICGVDQPIRITSLAAGQIAGSPQCP